MSPLAGRLVLDFSTLLPGPMATLLLAEAGAEVIKIERPGGEDMRRYTPGWGRDSANFALLNRGKKSVELDLKAEGAVERLRPLIERADIVVEQFRPGVMDRLGLGYDAVAAINPRIIYCSVTGYGQTGPKRDRAGHDLNYIGDTGLLRMSCGSPEQPVIPPALIGDIAGGSYPAVLNILLALIERDRTGLGRFIDVAMCDNLFTFMYWAMGSGQAASQWPGNGADLVTGGSPRYRLYATSDGEFVAAAPLEQKFWLRFCEALGLEAELRDDDVDPAATASRIEVLIGSQTARHWEAVFAAADCCVTIVASLQQAMADQHFQARGLFERRVANEAGQTMTALPVPIDATFRAPASTRTAPPVGADNGEIA